MDAPVTVATTAPADKTTKPKVLLALPWYKSTNPMTAFSVMGLIDRTRTALLLNFGDAFVAHTRNTIADLFLQSEVDWMLTIDDDMIVPFGNSRWFNAYTGFGLPEQFANLNALDRLLSHGKTLIGGLYFGRHNHGKPMYAEGCNQDQEAAAARQSPTNIIKPTRWVGTGCMLVHRSVFTDIEKKFPRLARHKDGGKFGGNWFTSSEHNLVDAIARAKQALAAGDNYQAQMALEQGTAAAQANSSMGMGEDVAFCIRAKQAGHQPFVDFGLVCGHVGDRVYGPRNTQARILKSA